MLRSTDRILTTHTGSLPRPQSLAEATDASRDEVLTKAVAEVVASQVDAGVDVVNDGEVSKPSYVTYVTERAEGFGGEGHGIGGVIDALEFPDWGEAMRQASEDVFVVPACIAPLKSKDDVSVGRDLDNLNAAIKSSDATSGFLTAPSPGAISLFIENKHYKDHEEYVSALGELMREEYEAINASGLALQLDCPDLAGSRGSFAFGELSLNEWLAVIEGHVEALNEATRDIPGENMRLHLCWGNYEGPHTSDVALREILPIVYKARPAAISFEAANPRHGHEWKAFEDVPLPDDKVIIPGLIDSTTNIVEHPELVAERILNFASIVGRERVIAGTDCGFATFAGIAPIFPSIAYGKLKSLSEGAAIASKQLWA